jgi:hypothetical protein
MAGKLSIKVLLLALHIYMTLQTQAKLLNIGSNMLMRKGTMAESRKPSV